MYEIFTENENHRYGRANMKVHLEKTLTNHIHVYTHQNQGQINSTNTFTYAY